jgi:molybdate transport system substrate-binding protein
MIGRRVSLAVVVMSLVVGCSTDGSSPPASVPGSASSSGASVAPSTPPAALTVFAAASLKKAFGDIESAYEAARPGTTLTFSFDASNALETQIEQGGPADVFASADIRNPQKLVDGGFATGPVTPFAGNLLTVIVPSANPAGISSPLDLARPGVKVIAAGDDVPITTYANQLIANLSDEAGYPADFADKVTANIVSKEDNVAAVVSKIDLGEGDVAIVYETDARNAASLASVAVPAGANVPATYGAVTVKASQHPAAAADFVAWLIGPEGRAILAWHGFLPPS